MKNEDSITEKIKLDDIIESVNKLMKSSNDSKEEILELTDSISPEVNTSHNEKYYEMLIEKKIAEWMNKNLSNVIAAVAKELTK